MQCDYFDDGRCSSCTHLRTPYATQLQRKHHQARLAIPDAHWQAPHASSEQGFRNKAKMVVTGTPGEIELGILNEAGRGVDLRGCNLHEAPIRHALPVLADFLAAARAVPYDVTSRRGEVKHLLVTSAPSSELMVRIVLRSTEARLRLIKQLPGLLIALPNVKVVSLNVQPLHAAILEGPDEETIHGNTLHVDLPTLGLHVGPQSFLQTNTAVATALYDQARAWVGQLAPASIWDLYCGVGGFALHLAAAGVTAPASRLVGVEVSEVAVASAQRSARDLGVGARFIAADATHWALKQPTGPELVVVNPPRRGLEADLCSWLDSPAGPRNVLYSSCNLTTLARDLARMGNLAPGPAKLFDMFPHTDHSEVLILLQRR